MWADEAEELSENLHLMSLYPQADDGRVQARRKALFFSSSSIHGRVVDDYLGKISNGKSKTAGDGILSCISVRPAPSW